MSTKGLCITGRLNISYITCPGLEHCKGLPGLISLSAVSSFTKLFDSFSGDKSKANGEKKTINISGSIFSQYFGLVKSAICKLID